MSVGPPGSTALPNARVFLLTDRHTARSASSPSAPNQPPYRKNRCVLSRYAPPPIKAEPGESSKPRVAPRAAIGAAAGTQISEAETKPRVKSSVTSSQAVAAAAAAAAAAGTNGKRKVRGSDRTAGREGGEATGGNGGGGGAGVRIRLVLGKGKVKAREESGTRKDAKGKGKPTAPSAAR